MTLFKLVISMLLLTISLFFVLFLSSIKFSREAKVGKRDYRIQSKVLQSINLTSKVDYRPRLHVVTYATHGGRDDRFCRAIESALMNNVNIVILGWSVKWVGLSQKLEAAKYYAKSMKPEDIMLFVDAFDVLFTASASEANILSSFKLSNSSILFSAECGCWPHVMEDPSICLQKYPKSPTPYRYLNSGAWVATASSAVSMLTAVQAKAGNNWVSANDQKLVGDMFINNEYGIKLDYQATIFQSMHETHDKPLPYCVPANDIKIKDGLYKNTLTGTYPAVFHFNGGGKLHHLKYESKARYKAVLRSSAVALSKLAMTELTTPNLHTKLKFKDICGSYLINEYNYKQ